MNSSKLDADKQSNPFSKRNIQKSIVEKTGLGLGSFQRFLFGGKTVRQIGQTITG